MKIKLTVFLRFLWIFLALIFHVQSVQAQILEEIIVTAQKREENLSDVPISVSAVSGDMIKNTSIQRAEDLSALVPNFSVSQGPISDSINIRGIQSGIQAGFEQSVASVVDDIYHGRGTQSRWAFLDVERVEVLRGPQPTLFGINTVAGAINITSARPTLNPEADISVTYNPAYKGEEIQGVLSGPLSDSVVARLAVLNRKLDEGWITNHHYDENNPAQDEFFARLSMEWDINDTSSLLLKYEHGDFDISGQPWVISEPGPIAPLMAAAGVPVGRIYETNMGNSGFPLLGLPADPVIDFGSVALFKGDTDEVMVKFSNELFNESRVELIGSYSAYDFERYFDADLNPMPVVRFDDAEDYKQQSLELRFSSDTGGQLEYIAGFYYQENEMTVDGLSQFSLNAIHTLLSGTCAALPGAPANVVPGDVVTSAVSVASLPGATATVTNACAQTALTQVLVPIGVNGAGRYAFLKQNTELEAAFTQLTWNVSDIVRTSLGLRFTTQKKSAYQGAYASEYAERNTVPLTDPSPANPKALSAYIIGEFTPHSYIPSDPGMTRNEDSLTWSLNTQWNITSDVMLYASAATGYKAGGYNSFYMGLPQGMGADSNAVDFDEEKVLTLEIGGKFDLMDGVAELNIAAFRTSYDDLQASVFSGNTTFIVQNAAEATSKGIEIDGRWQATDKLMIQAALGFLDFKFDKFPNQGCVAEQFLNYREQHFQKAIADSDPVSAGLASLVINNQSCASASINDMQGRISPQSPDWTGSLIANHEALLGGFNINTIVDFTFTDDVYRQDDLDPHSLQKAFAKLNAAISISPENGNWDLSLIGKNLMNEKTYSYVNDMPLFDAARISRMDPRRNFSIRVRYHF